MLRDVIADSAPLCAMMRALPGACARIFPEAESISATWGLLERQATLGAGIGRPLELSAVSERVAVSPARSVGREAIESEAGGVTRPPGDSLPRRFTRILVLSAKPPSAAITSARPGALARNAAVRGSSSTTAESLVDHTTLVLDRMRPARSRTSDARLVELPTVSGRAGRRAMMREAGLLLSMGAAERTEIWSALPEDVDAV